MKPHKASTILGRLRQSTQRQIALRYDDPLFTTLYKQALSLQEKKRVVVREVGMMGSAWIMIEEVRQNYWTTNPEEEERVE